MNKKAELGSPCPAPLFSLKYFVVIPPLMTHDSWMFVFLQQWHFCSPKDLYYNLGEGTY